MLSEDITLVADDLDRIARGLTGSGRATLANTLKCRISDLRHCAERAIKLEARAAALTTIPHQGKVS